VAESNWLTNVRLIKRVKTTSIPAHSLHLLVDTREQNPLDFSRLESWFAGIERKPLRLGDYSRAGLEDLCLVERKTNFACSVSWHEKIKKTSLSVTCLPSEVE
jgi:ERCC4-type nuclease